MIAKPTLREEKLLWKKNYNFVIGLDEVGRGAFAGPVVVAAVVFSPRNTGNNILSLGIHDSKLLSPKIRECLAKEIKKKSVWAIAKINVGVINNVGIGKATEMGFRKVVKKILCKGKGNNKAFVLIDGFYVKYIQKVGRKNQKAIIKGDQKSISIAAASIIAKVYRDNIMRKLDPKYPQYGFAKHKGYGTEIHQQAIKKHGLSKIHRKSFNLSHFLPL